MIGFIIIAIVFVGVGSFSLLLLLFDEDDDDDDDDDDNNMVLFINGRRLSLWVNYDDTAAYAFNSIQPGHPTLYNLFLICAFTFRQENQISVKRHDLF